MNKREAGRLSVDGFSEKLVRPEMNRNVQWKGGIKFNL